MPFPRNIAEHAGGTAGGIEQTGQHFEGGGLPRAVGAEKADEFPRLDGKADVLDRQGLLVLPAEEALTAPANPGCFL